MTYQRTESKYILSFIHKEATNDFLNNYFFLFQKLRNSTCNISPSANILQY